MPGLFFFDRVDRGRDIVLNMCGRVILRDVRTDKEWRDLTKTECNER